MLGHLVGTATIVRTEHDYSAYSSEGSVDFQLVVLLTHEDRGMVCQDKPTKAGYITHLLVDPSNARKAPIYVNVYERGQAYGGPEEGGWWYDTFDPVEVDDQQQDQQPVSNMDAARRLQRELEKEYPYTGKSSSVLGGEDYAVMIEFHPPEAQPKQKPRYE
jgi:hypothetical protein